MLTIRGLTKIYDDGTPALRGVDLTVARGEFVAVVGLSGSGKSTLLRCINRLIDPSAGTIEVDGTDMTAAQGEKLRAARRRIAMIFQQFNLVPRHSVLRNVLTGALGNKGAAAGVLGLFTAAERERARANLALVGIAEKSAARVEALSGGQKQRVAIARALMQEPVLLLADEPVASLDPATSHSVMKYLAALNREHGLTVLCNLHFLSLARRYGTRVIALKDGLIVYDGAPEGIDETRFREIYGEEAEEVEIR
ncbi:MAG TPA: phosphonate ABC transporter ATP-binding protein [bacterium]|nr:phosphonate ABC transporter ATP-binding protein [bacterium]